MNRIFGLRRSRRQRGEDPRTPARNEQPAHGGEEEPHGHAIDEVDAPFIDLESEREMQAYNLIKEREFLHSPAFDSAFLHQIGIDVEFDTIFKHLGWTRVAPIHELRSRLLTIQILGTLEIVDYGITFRFFGRDFSIYWKDLANRLGFHDLCSIDLGFSLRGYQRHATPCSSSGHTGRPQHSHGRIGAPEQADPRYAECPHPDCYPMASADPAELHRP